MIARMTAAGVITLEPQNGAEVVALEHWEQKNKITLPAHTVDDLGGSVGWRGAAIEIVKRD